MPLTLSVLDEATNGERRAAGPFEFETVAITLRELIRARVQQDVRRFNESESEPFHGLVQPEESERLLNGVPSRPLLVWQRQFEKASAPSTATASSFSSTTARSPTSTRRFISPLKAR
jgi:hypothetical protein